MEIVFKATMYCATRNRRMRYTIWSMAD